MQAGFKFSEITKHLGVHRSTIYREISRNRGLRSYRRLTRLTRKR